MFNLISGSVYGNKNKKSLLTISKYSWMDTKVEREEIMNNICWLEVGFDSGNINRIAYTEGDVFVEFKNGSGYKYLSVPVEIYQRIVNKECISKSEGKPSYGATLDKLVKKAGYQFEQYK